MAGEIFAKDCRSILLKSELYKIAKWLEGTSLESLRLVSTMRLQRCRISAIAWQQPRRVEYLSRWKRWAVESA